jgi:hypothetical protein
MRKKENRKADISGFLPARTGIKIITHVFLDHHKIKNILFMIP